MVRTSFLFHDPTYLGYEVNWEENAEVIECSYVLKHEDQTIDGEVCVALLSAVFKSQVCKVFGYKYK